MIRVLVAPGGGAEGTRLALRDEESHHVRVRRGADGEMVELRDGAGFVGLGRLIEAAKRWEVEVTRAERSEPPAELTLAVGAGDRDRFGWLAEKATELGVTAVIPLETERTSPVATRVRPQNLERLRRHALEAVKQSGAAWAARVEEAVSLAGLAAQPLVGRGWVADVGGEELPAVVEAVPLVVVIGPEGGLTGDEIDRLRGAGYLTVSLGPHTLRFETAAIAAAAAVSAGRRRRSHG